MAWHVLPLDFLERLGKKSQRSGALLRVFADHYMTKLNFGEAMNNQLRMFDFSRPMYRFPPTSSVEDVVREVDETESEFAIALQSCLLPSREGSRYWIEPYFPHRYARQFGFDQEIPLRLRRSPEKKGKRGSDRWYISWTRFRQPLRGCRLEPAAK